MENSIPNDIYTKLQKLLRKSESLKEIGNLAEAESFAMKAAEILMEYNLTHEQIDLQDKPKVIREWITNKMKNFLPKNEGRWVILLYHVIAKHNLCRTISHNGGKEGISIIGERINVDICRFICDQLEARLKPMAKETYKTYYGDEKRNAFIRGFLLGVIQGLNVKFSEYKKELMENANITALVVVKDKAVIEFMETEFKHLSFSKGDRSSAQDARSMGFEKGKSMDIHKGVGPGALDRNLLN